ncbi:hypothetical protein FB451DRAFT_1180644 [Mycena latifolia]|nr:hypothetical protein FB451DRAFT_1180644 [Mycena latifolia]
MPLSRSQFKRERIRVTDTVRFSTGILEFEEDLEEDMDLVAWKSRLAPCMQQALAALKVKGCWPQPDAASISSAPIDPYQSQASNVPLAPQGKKASLEQRRFSTRGSDHEPSLNTADRLGIDWSWNRSEALTQHRSLRLARPKMYPPSAKLRHLPEAPMYFANRKLLTTGSRNSPRLTSRSFQITDGWMIKDSVPGSEWLSLKHGEHRSLPSLTVLVSVQPGRVLVASRSAKLSFWAAALRVMNTTRSNILRDRYDTSCCDVDERSSSVRLSYGYWATKSGILWSQLVHDPS